MNWEPADDDAKNYVRRHVSFAWCSLLCFLTLGIVLEGLHAFKIHWYLDPEKMRRLMWTLGHAHGTLLSLVHIAFAATICMFPGKLQQGFQTASPCFFGASLLLPVGFFLGGLFVYEGDPGLGVWLAPFGAAVLFVAVSLTARAVIAQDRSAPSNDDKTEPQ